MASSATMTIGWLAILKRTILVMSVVVGIATESQASDPEGGDAPPRFAAILQAKCVRCHGGTSIKGGLSLASAAAMDQGGDSGPAIEPGKPDESLLIEKLIGDVPEMPRGGKPLAPEEIATLRRWIEEGAKWPDGLVLKEPKAEAGPWWAVQELKRPALPTIASQGQARTPIDVFILAALEAKGLALRPEADRRTLIRRLTYDLHGLPPTPEEIAAFESGKSADAYERLVDRLLASPRYGERWGRHWLDVVHYGDTHGYDKDKRRPNAWRYRDYVISALNADKPYVRFVQEQVAGDVLFPDDPQATIATGFVAAGPWDFVGHVELREGTVDKLKTRLIDRDDMVANTMSTFVSLTVHCARCHDHKFDPIPQQDYYRLQAVFAGVDRGDRPIHDAALARRKAELEARRAALTATLGDIQRAVAARRGPELVRLDDDLARWRKELADLPRPAGARPSPTNGYHSGIEPTPDATKWVQVDLGHRVPIDEIRLIPAHPVDFPDTPGFGFPARFHIELADEPTFAMAVRVADQTTADLPNPRDTWWVVRPSGKTGRFVRVTATKLWPRKDDYVFALGEVEVRSGGANLARGAAISALDSIEAGRWSTRHLVDGHDSRDQLDETDDAALVDRRAELCAQIQEGETRRISLAESLVTPELRGERDRVQAALAALQDEVKRLPETDQVYALVSHEPRSIQILNRGDVELPGDPVGPGTLSCVPGRASAFENTPEEGPRRAALARWLADRENPLPWRSIVNRAWHYHFGRGIVDTPNDFGRNGSVPTHPELLDWLASEFRDGGQSLKGLHRLIVTSAVYRQASHHDDAAAKVDADNRLYWRQNRRRLEAEAIRDATLFVAGRLDFRMGGPGFALFRFKDDHSPIYDHDDPSWIDPPEGRRRTVYRFIVRSVPNPFVECLDGADPNAMVPVRNTTITALQALALLNDPFMIAQAEAFAARLKSIGAHPGDRIREGYKLALGRRPTAEELRALVDFTARFGMTGTCRLILNLNEFVFVE
jgi:mono/diheme cytochrome c family protein